MDKHIQSKRVNFHFEHYHALRLKRAFFVYQWIISKNKGSSPKLVVKGLSEWTRAVSASTFLGEARKEHFHFEAGIFTCLNGTPYIIYWIINSLKIVSPIFPWVIHQLSRDSQNRQDYSKLVLSQGQLEMLNYSFEHQPFQTNHTKSVGYQLK